MGYVMNTDRCRFKFGDFECLAIRDVKWGGGNTGWFPNIPAEVSRPFLQAMNDSPAKRVSNVFLLR